MAICMDFTMKMGDFEAAWQKTLSEGTSILASRATQCWYGDLYGFYHENG